jgi:alpha-ribazole phosphatase
MRVYLIRHGRTQGNIEHRYIGITDSPLADEGKSELRAMSYPQVDKVVCSPMLRCIETAEIIYPAHKPIIIDELKECSFGLFENKTHEEIKDRKEYIRWIESEGRIDIPGAERRDDFTRRCVNGFNRAVEELNGCERLALVIHGGSIMALLQGMCGGDYFSYMVANGKGYSCEYADGKLSIISRFD